MKAAPIQKLNTSVIQLHEFGDQQFITKAELGAALGRTERTVLRMVARYELPPPIKLGKRAVWQVCEVKSWIVERANRQIQAAKSEAARFHITTM